MRTVSLLLIVLLMVLAGCQTEEAPAPQSSVLTFTYDAARDVVLAHTHALYAGQRYPEVAAAEAETSFIVSPTVRLANPDATVAEGTVTVNYRDVAGLETLSAAQATGALAAIAAWRWVPQTTQARVLAMGQPLLAVGPVALSQPLAPAYHTYVYSPTTGEVGHLVGGLTPASLPAAITLLQQREILDFPATQGFAPLLPVGTTMTVRTDQIVDGVLPVALPATFPRGEHLRLAGLVLNFTQFPSVRAVQFTFGGNRVDEAFMRSSLAVPLTPYDLVLPAVAASRASAETRRAVQAVVTANRDTEVQPEFGETLAWRGWVKQTVTTADDAAPVTYLLHEVDGKYMVVMRGAQLPVEALLLQGVPREALIALRLPGWENLALTA